MKRLAMVCLCALCATAEEEFVPIRDNSFFIEEAYNQESGIVQHIVFAPMLVTEDRLGEVVEFAGTFTQEWPIWGQEHQLSYTIPGIWERVEPRHEDAEREDGLGDILINYRYQILMDNPAFSPRLSVILPTGDREFRAERGGLQANLPLSVDVSRFTFHVNAGVTWLPNDRVDLGDDRSDPHDLVDFFGGVSAIWHASDTFDLMVEAVWGREEAIDDEGRPRADHVALIVPGIRWAINYESGLQVVFGLAAPIGLTDASPDWGVAFYLSVEHAFKKE